MPPVTSQARTACRNARAKVLGLVCLAVGVMIVLLARRAPVVLGAERALAHVGEQEVAPAVAGDTFAAVDDFAAMSRQ
jgi:hypothetical protein